MRVLSKEIQLLLSTHTLEPSCPGFPDSRINDTGLSIIILSEHHQNNILQNNNRYPLGRIHFNCISPLHNLIGNSHLDCIRKQQSAEWSGDLPYCGKISTF